MRGRSFQWLVLLAVIVTSCTAAPDISGPAVRTSTAPSVARLAGPPPLLGPGGQVRFVTTVSNEVRAEDAATSAVRWTLPTPVLASGSALHWRLLPSDDALSVYVQAVLDGRSPTYLGTRRIDARTGVELASDIKFESIGTKTSFSGLHSRMTAVCKWPSNVLLPQVAVTGCGPLTR
jgi:hypothetical protein